MKFTTTFNYITQTGHISVPITIEDKEVLPNNSNILMATIYTRNKYSIDFKTWNITFDRSKTPSIYAGEKPVDLFTAKLNTTLWQRIRLRILWNEYWILRNNRPKRALKWFLIIAVGAIIVGLINKVIGDC